jgi:dinuclear metal center YbgI/SA1388 family protein
MLASELIKLMEQKVPLKLALKDDRVGFIGPGRPEEIEVEKAAIFLDIIPGNYLNELEADLIVCHHPPLFFPPIPTYIIHSNWDIVQGGANDALAESLKIEVTDIFEDETGIGRICKLECTIEEFIEQVAMALDMDHLRIVKGNQRMIEKVAIISGFGLNKHYIKLASEKDVDLLLSGDLTHPGSILAHKLGITLIDATHQATELPGLIKLCQLISELGVKADLNNMGMPWETVLLKNYSIS